MRISSETLTKQAEMEFLNRLLDDGEIAPELLTADMELQDRINKHPLLGWKALNVREYKGRLDRRP